MTGPDFPRLQVGRAGMDLLDNFMAYDPKKRWCRPWIHLLLGFDTI